MFQDLGQKIGIQENSGSDLCADIEEHSEETGDWGSLLGHGHWWQSCLEASSAMKTLVFANTNLDSSLLLISTGTQPYPIHQPTG